MITISGTLKFFATDKQSASGIVYLDDKIKIYTKTFDATIFLQVVFTKYYESGWMSCNCFNS